MLHIFKHPRSIFITLIIAFCIFNVVVYALPEYSSSKEKEVNESDTDIAVGKQIWQDNNCHTCHQLYGLGGYLGPDLTNVVAKEGYTPKHIKSIVKNGIFQMPAFDLTEQELDELVKFLNEANRSGSAHPNDYSPTILGTFDKNQK
ncbi:MAG: c-type cytochrome [Moheibacter sp.]